MTTHKLAFFLDPNDKDVYSGRQIDLDAYRYACKAFGVKTMAVINPEKIEFEMNDQDMEFEEYESFQEFQEAHKDEGITLLAPPWSAPGGSVLLRKVDAPPWDDDDGPSIRETTDWYVVGSARGWIPQPEGVKWLTIKQEGKGALHGQHIATLLLSYLFITKKRR